ncbi:bifunctional (p)ppGpp synthetase/guanosine-3',5'-bis(diphosphate) 3'-pyrophosphohydrolase [Palleniella muris]|uniref:Bifunctional (P)ppGpp synthetase/guanosine-3',5'-bis(Diphosphate) 3'-pyrophosphohydrolase n=1 Tax=Palleniella muris TaxID=3038145 RepID=A0AC61QR85_9BACT|nr:RelA/SpoT family protein [Palleniella muris]TGX82637.1 bifunctional (p)ppGpp synthetase/guanosine-3',5'-bis(diphosphate) 3'-pyrophosphohydrolase [Palleniella muris]
MAEDILKRTDDESMVDAAFRKLLDCYMQSSHRQKVDIITQAFNFARQAHRGVRRLSGEPYIMHPLAVAYIACKEMGLGSTSICAALLHDVVEDTDYTIDDIESIFGSKIATIVNGLTKISGGIFGDKASAQAENFKKLLLTMSDDIRVILIKICDRLHNMRTLASQPANKQYKIAGETLYIYAPLANRLGLNKIKTELEDLSFRYEHPEEYENICRKLKSTQEQRDMLFDEFTSPIRAALDKMGMQYEIKARVKSPYSIWNKMRNKHVTFDEIYDILAVRIICSPREGEDEINECFQIYVAVSKLYKAHPDRLRDWLNHPKANGYQALHVTLMSLLGRWIEVQIRSKHMDEIAEQGFAAHWKYKAGENSPDDERDKELNDWLRTIKEILDDPQPDAMDFLDTIKLNLFASEIFVFTPKGEIVTMPAECTALDFAYNIHTFIGSHCIGAKVNHKLVPLSHKLQSGDQVEVLTSKAQHVQPEWINFVFTAKAKGKIQAQLRRDEKVIRSEGEEMLRQWFKEHDTEMTVSLVDKLCDLLEVHKHDQLYLGIGRKSFVLDDVLHKKLTGKKRKAVDIAGWRKYVPFIKAEKKKAVKTEDKFIVTDDFDKKKPVYLTEETIGKYIFPDCCHAIPGDDILGYIDNKNRIKIHRRDCPVAIRLKSSYGNRIVDAKWGMHNQMLFDAGIFAKGIDRIGLLKDVTQILSDELQLNIKSVNINCENELFEAHFAIRVHHRAEVQDIIKKLRGIQGIEEISME